MKTLGVLAASVIAVIGLVALAPAASAEAATACNIVWTSTTSKGIFGTSPADFSQRSYVVSLKATNKAASSETCRTASTHTWRTPSGATMYWIAGQTTDSSYVNKASNAASVTFKTSWLGGGKSQFYTVAYVINKDFTTGALPTISGVATVGNLLGVTHGEWSPIPTSYTYQWFRDGAKISGATKATYRLTASDRGRNISAWVAGHKLFYNDNRILSSRSVKVS